MCIRDSHPAARILSYSAQPEDRLSLRVLDAGAAGYLSKDHGADELLRAIQTVARGDQQQVQGCEQQFKRPADLQECLLPNRRVEVLIEARRP